MNGTCNSPIFLVPAPWGLGEGPKGQISFNLNYKVNYQTLCVFSQMKDLKHIRQDFHFVPWVMPQGLGLVVGGGGLGGQKIYFLNMVMWHIN